MANDSDPKKTLMARKLVELSRRFDSMTQIINNFMIWFEAIEKQNLNGYSGKKRIKA
mgnify:CR=1 FL=1